MKLVGLLFKEEGQISLLSTGKTGKESVEARTKVTKPEMAMAVLREIDERAKDAGVELEDLVVVFKDENGETRIKQARDMTAGKGARRGSFWGLLVGLLLGGPLGGLLGGMALGAIYGKKVDHGLDDKFIKDIGDALQRGESAVLVLIKPEDYDQSIAYLKSFDARLYEAEINAETHTAVLEAAEDESVQQAVKAEFDVD